MEPKYYFEINRYDFNVQIVFSLARAILQLMYVLNMSSHGKKLQPFDILAVFHLSRTSSRIEWPYNTL